MMRILPHRRAAVILLFITALGAATLAGSPNSSLAEGSRVAAIDIETPPEVLAAIANGPSREPAQPMSSPLQAEVTVMQENFDGEEFPPAGWQYGISGRPDTPEFQWSRETCTVDTRVPGNVAAAWSLGGGVGGDALPCGSPYTQPVTAFLLTGPYDARNLAGGVSFEWLSIHNIPADRGNDFPYGVCVALPSSSRCIVPQEFVRLEWSFYDSLPIIQAAGLEEVWFYLLYHDRAPTGQHTGAFVDNLRVVGHTGPPEPTETSTPAPPPAGDRAINLPITWKSASKADLPALAPSQPGATAALGLGLTGLSWNNVVLDARLVNSGSAFQYGQMLLCTRATWWGQTPGTALHWAWYHNGQPVAPENTDVNPTIQVPTSHGSAGNCVANVLDGNRVPLPLGRFEVRTSLNDVMSGAGSAVIQDGPPPGATAIPTAYPTIAPSPTPPETPGSDQCRTTIVNGDFERGPSVAWRLRMLPVIAGRTIADIIGNNNPATSGMWAARLGGVLVPGDDYVEEIVQDSSPTGLIDANRMISATLRASLMMLTEETRDGNVDDELFFALVNREDGQMYEVVVSANEELLAPNQYVRFAEDVTAAMTKRTGWDNSLLVIQSVQNDSAGSNFLVDDVEIEVCRTTGARQEQPAADANALPRAISGGAGPERPNSLHDRATRPFRPQTGTRLIKSDTAEGRPVSGSAAAPRVWVSPAPAR